MSYMGIDPGLDGGVAVIDHTGITLYKMPTITTTGTGKTKKGNPKTKREYDLDAIRKILCAHLDATPVIEKVHAMPGQGVRSMFSMGYGLGVWESALSMFQFPLRRVTPQAWKAAVLSGEHKDKKASALVAARLYPQVASQLIGPHGGVHDGLSDALLLAEYGRLAGF